MAPLILHNVPDEELYIGEDGIQRPYAMIYPDQDRNPGGMRARRAAPETGAFGKSTRRSRSKTATPAKREDPTIQSAHKVFAAFFQQQSSQTEDAAEDPSSTPRQRKASIASALLPSTSTNADLTDDAAAAAAAQPTPRSLPKVPTEIILRGFKNTDQQYAAINHFEQIAGRICEDYPRDPPFEIRRYKSDLRDPAFTRRREMTPEERVKVNRADSGDHWVKVTFESSQAADAAMFSSPQAILGHLVYAEPYRGLPPLRDEAVPDATTTALGDEIPIGWRRPGHGGNRTAGELRTTFAGGALPREIMADDAMDMDMSPPHSLTSSRTVESGTVNGSTSSSNTVTGPSIPGAIAAAPLLVVAEPAPAENSVYCRRIPTARRAVLLPAEQALLPQQSYAQRILSGIPFLTWFSGSMIGNEVPRTAEGEFDWVNASLYWKVICWLDWMFRLFGGEVVFADKDD
ncbi:Nucleoporin NUP53 [Cytospora mali]|uniref:Nucleoporin NUP53 n=1 Tax=Cytospora mali TaxID=578113 RepID=A0A194W133_CYTMA|nr:Nucleoporin NUP53 [Valsa mali]